MVGSRAMKLGCLGCLGTILGLLLLCGLVGWGPLGLDRDLRHPRAPAGRAGPGRTPALSSESWPRSAFAASGRSDRSEPLLFSEPEVATLLSTYLSDAGLGLSPVAVRLRPGSGLAPGAVTL